MLVRDGGNIVWADQIPYAAGTFTPSFSFTGPGDVSVAYTKRVGRYTRVGNRVFIDLVMWFTPTWSTSTGQGVVLGLPFTTPGSIYGAAAGEGFYVPCATSNVSFPTGATDVVGRLNGGASTISFLGMIDADPLENLRTTEFPSGTAMRLSMNFSYEIE